jgi:hypothetical protein
MKIFTRTRLRPILLCVLATFGLAMGSAAHALYAFDSTQALVFGTNYSATHTYTGNQSTLFTSTPESLFFSQFDTLDGRRTLTNVTITWTPTNTAVYAFNNGSGNARNLSLSFNTTSLLSSSLFTASTTFPNPAINVIIPRQSQGGLSSVPINNTGNLINLPTPDFNPFIGASQIQVTNTLTNLTSLLTATQGGLGNLSGSSSGSVGGTLEVTYSWLDPIPEPGTWAMLILGFGLVGATMRRRRSALAHSAQ